MNFEIVLGRKNMLGGKYTNIFSQKRIAHCLSGEYCLGMQFGVGNWKPQIDWLELLCKQGLARQMF